MQPIKIKFRKLSKNAKMPVRAPGYPAGLDLFAAKSVTIESDTVKIVPTDLAWEISPEFYGQIQDRSGIGSKTTLGKKCGVIDPDYRGNIGIVFFNSGKDPVNVNKGDKIAQMVIHRRYEIELEEVADLTDSIRNAGGFGSTG